MFNFVYIPFHQGPVKVAISGGVAGACFWASVFPTDVVKSRVQVGVQLLLFFFDILTFSSLTFSFRILKSFFSSQP